MSLARSFCALCLIKTAAQSLVFISCLSWCCQRWNSLTIKGPGEPGLAGIGYINQRKKLRNASTSPYLSKLKQEWENLERRGWDFSIPLEKLIIKCEKEKKPVIMSRNNKKP